MRHLFWYSIRFLDWPQDFMKRTWNLWRRKNGERFRFGFDEIPRHYLFGMKRSLRIQCLIKMFGNRRSNRGCGKFVQTIFESTHQQVTPLCFVLDSLNSTFSKGLEKYIRLSIQFDLKLTNTGPVDELSWNIFLSLIILTAKCQDKDTATRKE